MFFTKQDTTANKCFISSRKYAEFSSKLQVLLHYHNPTCAYNHHFNLHQKNVSLLRSILTYLSHPCLFTKSSLQSPLTLLSSILQQFFTSLFCLQPSQQSTPKIFSLSQSFSQFRLREGTRELGSLMRNDTVLISPFFLKVWTVIAGFATTNSLLSRLRKLVYCRQQPLIQMLEIAMANIPIHFLQ